MLDPPGTRSAQETDHPADMNIAQRLFPPGHNSSLSFLVLVFGIQRTFFLDLYWGCSNTFLLSNFYFVIFFLRPPKSSVITMLLEENHGRISEVNIILHQDRKTSAFQSRNRERSRLGCGKGGCQAQLHPGEPCGLEQVSPRSR